MSCELTRGSLHGYFDGELDAARAAEFEQHLQRCPECLAALDDLESLRSAVQRSKLYERAPESLRRGVDSALAPSSAQLAPRRIHWQWFAAAAALLLVAIAGWQFLPLRPADSGLTLTAAAVDAHLRSLQPGHLSDVLSTDQHTVKPWFDGKLDFSPPVRDFSPQGFPLQGGRLDVISGRTIAALVYGRRKHIVSVFVWPAHEKDAAPRAGSEQGYNWLYWRRGGMEFCAVSDASAADLEQLQQLFSE